MNGIFRNGSWKGTLSGAAAVALLALGWNVWHTLTSEGREGNRETIESASNEAARWALVLKHIEETEPLKSDYIATKQQVVLNAQAITAIQTGMSTMQEDLRAIRDYIYGQRPREPRRSP